MSFGYVLAVKQQLARAAQQGRDTMPLGVLVAVHAADVLDPGNLTLGNLQIQYNGVAFTSVHQLAPILTVPGVRFQTPTVANTDGTVNTIAPDETITSDFHYDELGTLYGSTLVDYIATLIDLWQNQVARIGALTDYQLGRVLLLLRAGVIVVPANPATLTNLAYPTELRTVAAPYADAWAKAVEAFKPANSAYAAGNYALAVSAAKAAAANAALWEGVYAAVQAVNELPQTIAEGAAKTAGFALSAFGWKNWLIVGGAIGAILIIRSLPSLAVKAAARAA